MRSRRRSAFTLVELIVVIGIIAVLVALALPGLNRVRKVARRTRLAADLNSIAVALEAYKGDFGDYPRPDDQDADTYRGAAALCRAMLGPGDATQDGADGFGFRATRINGTPAGRIYGPYVHAEQFKVANAPVSPNSPLMLDMTGNPIIYYVARPGPPNIHVENGYVALAFRYYAAQVLPTPLYNYYDNAGPYSYALDRMRVLLGDFNLNGGIDANETAATTAPYLLWCAGDDGHYGLLQDPRSMSISDRQSTRQQVDDVTNFNFN